MLDEDVPAGTSSTSMTEPNPICHIQGVGGIEPDDARKLACDADLLGAVIDAYGDALALGRTRRLVPRCHRQFGAHRSARPRRRSAAIDQVPDELGELTWV